MSDELFVKFNEFIKKGYLNYDAEQFLALLKEKGLEQGTEEYNKEMDIYASVTFDKVLKTILPELLSYDLNHAGTDIKTLYAVRKRELEQSSFEVKKEEKPASVEQPVPATAPIEAPTAPATGPVEVPAETPLTAPIEPSNTGLQDGLTPDIRIDQDINQKIANSEAITDQGTAPSKVEVQTKKRTLGLTNPSVPKGVKINQTGYANIVLMSIIVIIIVAIICVFIFM